MAACWSAKMLSRWVAAFAIAGFALLTLTPGSLDARERAAARPILHLMGLDHTKLTYKFQGRDFWLTDVHGRVVTKLLA